MDLELLVPLATLVVLESKVNMESVAPRDQQVPEDLLVQLVLQDKLEVLGIQELQAHLGRMELMELLEELYVTYI